MDAQTILRIKPALTQDLHEFDDCMGRVTNRRHTALVGPPPRRRSPRAFYRWANPARPSRSSQLGDPAAPPLSTESSVTTSALAMFVFQGNERQ